ncbi:MAG TPA: hypothetical protein V6C69_18635 [Trichormus sp.]|jgi:hypothetical protein
MKTVTTRPHWPHTLEDVTNSLEGIWGLVGASGTNGNLYRLERSLHEPLTYTLTEYRGEDESDVVRRQMYGQEQRDEAIREFAQAIGFEIS